MSDIEFVVSSLSDGWAISIHQDEDTLGTYYWDHEEFENGVGGELLFGKILEILGHKVEYKECY